MPRVYVKILLLSVLAVFFIGFIEYVYAQIPIPQIVDDPVADIYIALLFTLLVFIIPSIVFTYKKHILIMKLSTKTNVDNFLETMVQYFF